MAKKIVKVVLILLMFAGICVSIFNFTSVESKAEYVIWQDLEEGTDPILGTKFIRCFRTGQACVTVYADQ